MNSEPKNAEDLSPEEALSMEEGDALLHNETVVFVEKVEEGFGLLDEGEVMVWAAAEDGEGRGIPIKETEV